MNQSSENGERSNSEKETSEENYDEPNIDEKENEDQDFLISVESEKDNGTIWELIQLLPPPSKGRKDGNRKGFSIWNP